LLTCLFLLISAQDSFGNCTCIIVGKKASADGSVITSQTGCCDECRVHVVPAQVFKPGTMAPVYWGMQDVRKPFGPPYGQILGYVPQAEKTYAYFHTGYPQMNEYQLAIGETTLSQRDELKPFQGRSRSLLRPSGFPLKGLRLLQRRIWRDLLFLNLSNCFGRHCV